VPATGRSFAAHRDRFIADDSKPARPRHAETSKLC